jgi:ABC-type siderophore export system fused ATPase/permease subunit
MIRAEDVANCQLRNAGPCLWTAAPSVISTWLQRILQEVLVFQEKKGGTELTNQYGHVAVGVGEIPIHWPRRRYVTTDCE